MENNIPVKNSLDSMEGIPQQEKFDDKNMDGKSSFEPKVFSDEEVISALRKVEINPINISILRPFEGMDGRTLECVKKIIEETQCTKLTDLGCNRSIEIVAKKIAGLGFEEYVGIDLAIESEEYETEENLKVKLIKGEILTALRKMDDTSSHFCMSGIEFGTVVSGNVLDWGRIVLSEIRRSLPENGILYTDVGKGFLHRVLENEGKILEDGCKDFDEKIRFLKVYIWGRTNPDDLKRRFPHYSIDDFVTNEDTGFLGDYYFDLPESGFRLFLSEEYVQMQQSYVPVILQKIDLSKQK